MARFDGFGDSSLEGMASSFAGLMGSSNQEEAASTYPPPYGIEFVGVTKDCAPYKNFPHVLPAKERDVCLAARSNNGNPRAGGGLVGKLIEILITDATYYPIFVNLMGKGTCIDTVKIHTFEAVNEEDEKGINDIASYEFYTCQIKAVKPIGRYDMFLMFNYIQFLPVQKHRDAEGKAIGNTAGSIDLGSSEVGKIEKGKA